MKHKLIFWLMLAVIVIFSWVDYQYFNEALADNYSALQRQVAHIIILVAIVPVGYVAWRLLPVMWLRQLWLVSYVFVICIIGLIGAIQWKTAYFSTSFLDNISTLRLFFCSPLPFLMLYVLHNTLKSNTLKQAAV